MILRNTSKWQKPKILTVMDTRPIASARFAMII